MLRPKRGLSEGTPLTVPVHLVSESNQREHWAQKHRRAQAQRLLVYYTLRQHGGPVRPALPCTITLIRIAPRALDADNLVACFKAVQDAVADWLAGGLYQGQDRQPGLTWRYGQRRDLRVYALEITVTEGDIP
jgi:hypothetical protein